MKKLALFFFIFLSVSCFAQFSKTHYIPPITANTNLVGDHYIYISTPSLTNVNFKIIEIGGGIITGVVKNATPYVYSIGSGDNTQLFTPKSSIEKISNKGYIIEAENLIYASVRVNSGLSNTGAYVHAGGLVSKGNSALGKEFRLGAMLNPFIDTTLLNFGSILATENNTVVTISNIPIGTVLTNGTIVNGPFTVTLNKNESYVIAAENNNSTVTNSANLIGTLIVTDKNVVVNSGSFAGSNYTSTCCRDVGFDQIVPFEITGKEYIFVKGVGNNTVEQVLLIANVDATNIFLNGNTTPFAVLNKGQYVSIDGSNFINNNLYVATSEKVFAYQSIGGASSAANQNMFFVPPLNCSTPNIVDNIPLIEQIGSVNFNGGLNIVTETGATVKINNVALTATPTAVTGTPNYVTYTVNGLSGNIAINSTKQVYVSYFGSNGAATYGGYYSGFDVKPEIISDKITITNTNCIPNVVLKVSSVLAYDSFEWFFNDVTIPGATTNSYTPSQPGFYKVKVKNSSCGNFVFSDNIPVSECATNIDNDLANDNIDIDNDNDGITNCTESFGNQDINISNFNAGTINLGTYSNSFTGTVSTSSIATITPIIGANDGSFVSEVSAGKGIYSSYNLSFTNPINLSLEYVTTANTTDLINPNAEYIVNCDINKTITVWNPTNQLLIDTNYDGIYESGVTQHSSFEIRFIINGNVPLAAGTGTFKFQSYQVSNFKITHKNLLDSAGNKSTFKFIATCIPKDSDGDGTDDQLDSDSDNDGILDFIEAQPNTSLPLSNTDTNLNGLDNAFEPGLNPVDTDSDGVLDYLDLDSDNDGILDSVETENDLDADGIRNYRDLDSDKDLCSDVIEAGFLDPNGDGILGNSPVIVDANGLVIGAPYSIPNPNYLISAPIVITTQPIVSPTCELQNASITLTDNVGNTYQWQLSIDGINWTDLINDATYSNVTTNTLTITNVTNAMNGFKYRVQLNKTGNSCGLTSADTILSILALPVVNPITIIQCDDDLDAISTFNLTVNNNSISSNAANETFTYYTTLAGANTGDVTKLITTPLAFTNTTPSIMPVWARVTNSNGCFRVAQITLQVLATQIPSTFKRSFETCDDFLDATNDDRDGISSFNFSSVTLDLQALLPPGNYTITYYRNESDALAELNVITDISNYRNIGYPNFQIIWGRVDSDVDNACYGLGPYINLNVEKLPYANAVTITRQCDDNQDGIYIFNTSALETTLLNGQTNVTVTYFDASNAPLASPFPATFSTKFQTIKAVVTNNTSLKCYDETTIQFIVDDLPEAFAIPISLTTTCDDELNPLVQDGKYAFNTSTLETVILGGQTGMTVKYFDGNGNSLPSPLPNPFVTTTQNVKVIVENPINTNCTASINIPFVVNPLPNINLNTDGNDDELVCSNDPTFFVQLNAGIQDGSNPNNYTYIWSKDGVVLSGKTAYTLDVNAEGIYTVEVANTFGCSSIRTIKVTASDLAKIDSIDIEDMADTNTVTINVSGLGDYEYSLDEPAGYFQDSNTFTNITAGIHEVFVNDKNGCGVVTKSIAVVGVPKFFTPNGDGYNDYWNVKGVNATFYSKSIIYIFDRYGKLLKQWVPGTTEGWDGTFNGNLMPGDDYWYTVKLEDGREAKGHFSLKR